MGIDFSKFTSSFKTLWNEATKDNIVTLEEQSKFDAKDRSIFFKMLEESPETFQNIEIEYVTAQKNNDTSKQTLTMYSGNKANEGRLDLKEKTLKLYPNAAFGYLKNGIVTLYDKSGHIIKDEQGNYARFNMKDENSGIANWYMKHTQKFDLETLTAMQNLDQKINQAEDVDEDYSTLMQGIKIKELKNASEDEKQDFFNKMEAKIESKREQARMTFKQATEMLYEAHENGTLSEKGEAFYNALMSNAQVLDGDIGLTRFKEVMKKMSGVNWAADFMTDAIDDGDDNNLSFGEKAVELVKGGGRAIDNFIGTQGLAFILALSGATEASTVVGAGEAFSMMTQAYFLYEGANITAEGIRDAINATTKEEANEAGEKIGTGTIMLAGTGKSIKKAGEKQTNEKLNREALENKNGTIESKTENTAKNNAPSAKAELPLETSTVKGEEPYVKPKELQDDIMSETSSKTNANKFKVERIGTSQNKCGVLELQNSNGEQVGVVNYDLREVNGQKVLHFEGLKSNISGAGVGSKLIKELVKLSNELGAEGRVVATASPIMSPNGKLTNMGFYYKLGFKATDATKDAEIRKLLAEGKEIPISLNVFTDIELTPEGIVKNTITKQSSLQDVNNNNIKEKFKEKLVEIGVDDIEEQTLLTNFLLDASNIIDRNTQINITNAQLEFLKSKGATFENTYLLAPQPSGPKKLKSYTNATRALLEISNNENSILPLNINNTKCEIGDFQRTIFEQNEQGKKFIVLTDDCSLSGASMLEDSLTKLNSGTNLKTGQNVEIVFVPTVLGTKAVHTINNFIKCYEQLTSSDVVMLEKAIKKKNTENLSPIALQMYHIIEEITDFNSKTPEKDKSSITIAKTIKNAIKTKEKGGNISFSLANVSETYPVQLAQDFRNTLYYQNLSNEKKDIISSWLTADGQSFGYHSSATSVIIEGFDCKYDFMQKIDNKDTQRALGYKEDGTPHNIPLKGNAPNNNVILTQILAEVMGIDKKRIKASGETFPEIQYKLKQHDLTSIVNQKYQNGMVTSGRAIKIEFAIKPGGNYDGKISILGKTFDSGCKIEVLNKEGTTLFSQQLPNIQPGTSFLEAIPQIRKELNLNNFEDNKATIVHGTKIIDEKYDKPLQYYPGEQENYIIAIPKLESNNIIVKVNGEIIDF